MLTRDEQETQLLTFAERTLVLVKPDAVARGLAGEIIRRFEQAGLAIVGLKVVRSTPEHATRHYRCTDARLEELGNNTLAAYEELRMDPLEHLGTSDAREIGKLICEWSVAFLTAGPVIACVVQGVHAVKKVRRICGSTMPSDAPIGTIRGDFSSSSPAVANALRSAVRNLVHASDAATDPEEPEREIALWFQPDELVPYEPAVLRAMFA
jgi:nucleoside-diphosphate kinase